MPGTFSRIKTWAIEILTFSDLNAEIDNIINNCDPDGIDDASANSTAMQAMADPYPASVISLPTDLRGELQRLRYQLDGIVGKAQWYFDADTNLVLEFNKGADIASANAFPPGTDGNYFDVTGTTAITSIDTRRIGSIIRLHFDAALTLTHHATDLILPTGANITTAAGDEATFIEYATGDWRCIQYQRADGFSVAGGSTAIRDISRNLVVLTATAATVDIDADEVLLQNSVASPFRASSVNLTVDITGSGANGLDTGSEASSTWYFLYVIYNGSTTASLLSVSATSPTMPSGYTHKALVGAVRNDSGDDFIDFRQLGSKVRYKDPQTIIDGALTTDTWTSMAMGNFFPSTAKEVKIATGAEGSGVNEGFGLAQGSSGEYAEIWLAMSGGSAQETFNVFPTDRAGWGVLKTEFASTLYYFATDTPGSIMAMGYEF